MKSDFTPVQPDYYDIFRDEQKKEFSKVFYFGKGSELEEAAGKISGMKNKGNFEKYMIFDSGDKVRVDRIITINGIPGPAYDEYDAYALACLNCNEQAD
jgi:hypothetical protein